MLWRVYEIRDLGHLPIILIPEKEEVIVELDGRRVVYLVGRHLASILSITQLLQ